LQCIKLYIGAVILKNFRILREDRQCTYNITWRRVCTTIVGVEKQ